MDSVFLSIMLYLALISSPGTYTQSHIETIAQDNQAEIDLVRADENLTQWIWDEYSEEVKFVIISDTHGED